MHDYSALFRRMWFADGGQWTGAGPAVERIALAEYRQTEGTTTQWYALLLPGGTFSLRTLGDFR